MFCFFCQRVDLLFNAKYSLYVHKDQFPTTTIHGIKQAKAENLFNFHSNAMIQVDHDNVPKTPGSSQYMKMDVLIGIQGNDVLEYKRYYLHNNNKGSQQSCKKTTSMHS